MVRVRPVLPPSSLVLPPLFWRDITACASITVLLKRVAKCPLVPLPLPCVYWGEKGGKVGMSGYRLVPLGFLPHGPTVPVSRVSHSLEASTGPHHLLLPVRTLSSHRPMCMSSALRPSADLGECPVSKYSPCPARARPRVMPAGTSGIPGSAHVAAELRDPWLCARSSRALPTVASLSCTCLQGASHCGPSEDSSNAAVTVTVAGGRGSDDNPVVPHHRHAFSHLESIERRRGVVRPRHLVI